MLNNPLDQIEDEKAHRDIGAVAFRVFDGARAEGASRLEAFMIVCAWFKAMFEHAINLESEPGEDE